MLMLMRTTRERKIRSLHLMLGMVMNKMILFYLYMILGHGIILIIGILIEKGPVRELGLEFPARPDDVEGRRFSYAYYSRKSHDVDLDDFFSELKVLKVTLPDDLMSAPEILQFVTAVGCYPNVSVAYRILLTIPVTVASAERSFSKLKLLKNCLRSTMLQERLNGLATCCIEKDILDRIDLDTLINDFASRNARRSFFVKN